MPEREYTITARLAHLDISDLSQTTAFYRVVSPAGVTVTETTDGDYVKDLTFILNNAWLQRMEVS